MDNGILLKSGTGELEILEFVINNKHYAINIIKVKEVVEVDNLTELPNEHPAISGLILCRNEIITLIDLKYILDGERSSKNKSKVIICEFNQMKVAFSIDDIVAVHRIKWESIVKPDDMSTSSLIIGNILINKKIILLLDFEKIVTDINPGAGISEEKVINIEYKDRSNIKLILADDSALIRKLLKDTLTKAGFKNLRVFNDGKQTLNYLYDLSESKKEKFIDDVHLLITDIEMPQMDGHTLTRKIKEHPILHKLPVVIFSSLITDELKHKGYEVGADEQLSKPEIGHLVECIDKYIDKLNY
ncbi:chemotaxis protein CheV [Clostridium botulinum C]|uniref:Stage 0 sporulation protein A homolog n=1 Tax=Clostridium botulinum C TaxID=36828 RepID=A0A9Q3V8M3_CLOBO|nr:MULTISPECIES: chemotaxis protein [Clostridium]MCD3194495.1 chemotaxis protein CheV [Clostridium botulinum C]MCD3199649.1 chemotaxis protein CheV [Clostridium botulinum C]MCD3205124.1 chemotaxis protein CheV [Clostridium botulinum C]MCD3209220.1 chemotaxis protein CheV [Clostridium botulinum C]MCD3216192.1 chemotaxis protein CheV [Clostridium botulinum C]